LLLHGRGTLIAKQEYRGLFLSAIVLQTFAHHFDSIGGARNVPGLHCDGSEPRGALALSAAAVSCLIQFFHR
jgi:hypothetical protein